jgi:predicted glutamine amidotransferase
MCIIAVKPENLLLDDVILKTMWDNNKDGAGLMYAKDAHLHVIKGLMTFPEFLQEYNKVKHERLVLHFRIRTHGKTDAEMTHPFVVDDSLAFAHNGVILGLGDQTHSDTWYFNEVLIKKMRSEVANFLNIDPIRNLLADKVGSSKLVFMDNLGEITIINESKGDKSSDGVWFSNTSWRPKVNQVFTAPLRFALNNTEKVESAIIETDYSEEQLEIGDYATINTKLVSLAYEDEKKPKAFVDVMEGYPVEIKAFNQDFSVDVFSFTLDRLLRVRNCIYLDKINTCGWLRKSWGHMQAGKRLEVVSFDDKYALCIDSVLNRQYTIPTKALFISITPRRTN